MNINKFLNNISKKNIIIYLKNILLKKEKILLSSVKRGLNLDDIILIFNDISNYLENQNYNLDLLKVLNLPNILDDRVQTETQIIKVVEAVKIKKYYNLDISKIDILDKYLHQETNNNKFRKINFLYPCQKLLKQILKDLEQHAINNGYTFINISEVANITKCYISAHLPFFENQMYQLNEENFLIPTGELNLINWVLKETKDNFNCFTLSKCFRKEGGTYGKNYKYIRQNEFIKQELISICRPEDFNIHFDLMFNTIESFIQSLGLKYRILLNGSLDMSMASGITFDFEIWSKSKNRYIEVSSLSNMFTIQSERYNLFLGEKNNLRYTINGSCLPLERLIFLILDDLLEK